MKKVTIIGAGLSGLTIARILTDNDFEVEVFEQKEEIGGAIIDKIIDNKLVHIYGPHIFHTSNEEV
jgi:UDP-galactopyranose mutase